MHGIQSPFLLPVLTEVYGGEKRWERCSALSVINKRKMSSRLKICLRLLLWLCLGKVLQDVAAGVSPSDSSVSDANRMFEILLGGLEMDQDNNVVLLDGEMASMRQGRAFLSRINDNIPRGRGSMVQMLSALQGQRRRGPLTQGEFENVVLSMVYSAQQARQQDGEEEREAWGEVLLQLANVTVHELRGSYLLSYA
ncbi:uncharacterized protein LOC125015117 isoform X2 [Mugil cephalus]|nr:uncharacterized protein LOC125015117 isoform X2 [Mugil cephalus]